MTKTATSERDESWVREKVASPPQPNTARLK
jgi:hypothetical protein